MRQFMLPDLGEGLEEAEIVAWYVNEGDHVVADQPLVSVETDKAVVEVPSPSSGRIARVFGGKGDVVKVGAPLVEFAEGVEQDTGTVVGELGSGEHPPAQRTLRAADWAADAGPSRGARARAQARCRSQPCRLRAPAAPSHGRTLNALRRVWPRPAALSPCEACGARWRNA